MYHSIYKRHFRISNREKCRTFQWFSIDCNSFSLSCGSFSTKEWQRRTKHWTNIKAYFFWVQSAKYHKFKHLFKTIADVARGD